MALKKLFVSIVITIPLVLSACSLTGPSIIAPTDSNPAASTAAFQTEVAGIVFGTQAAQTALGGAVAQTLAAIVTNTPEFTPTPSLTPMPSLTYTPTISLTPNYPRVSVSVETNCRSGPGTVYDKLGVLRVGETAEVVGRDSGSGNWIIRLPSNPAIICWLWRNYATVVGETTAVPVFTIPPTPTQKFTSTPEASFSVSYVDVTACAPAYAFHFQVNNTGKVTWESIRIVITDTTASSTTTHTLDSFRSYEGCALEINQLNLDPGEGGHVANINPGQLNYDPTGHQFTAVVTVCSQDGLAGTCLSKTINFKP